MSLLPGKRLGSFEITSLIGSGGMGEVYRAKDLKLGREVAIKALPDLFAKDKERLTRFDREARLLASLNHSNIATIYGLEESDGEHYLVLELVEGETLAERLRRGPIPLEEALPLFTQIAEALETAHEKGIIHRDLKPANIKITPEGKVKVLDFGLAKALAGDAPAGSGLSESPTITKDATGTGVLLGTAPYMSPEQARGKDVDKRADIWAFGCCLYEALTGKVAFLGETVSDTIARILKEEPDWSSLPTQIPSLIKSLLRRCLQKDLQKRLHDIADARIEIEESLAEPFVDETAISQAGPPTNTRRLWGLAVLFVGLIAGGLIVHLATRPGPALPHQPKRLNIYLPPSPQMVDVFSGPGTLTLSPDGTRIVFVGVSEGGRRLYMRSIGGLDVTPIQGTERAWNPFFSPDSQWLGFSAGGQLKKVSVHGGEPLVICDAAFVRGASWGADGTIVFGGQGLARVSSEGGTPEVVTTLDATRKEAVHRWPQILPGGRAVVFDTVTVTKEKSVEVVLLETCERRVLAEKGTYSRYVPTGRLLFARADTILAAPFDLESLELTGTPEPVLRDVRVGDTNGLALYEVSQRGSLIYVPGYPRPVDSALIWVDRNGNVELLTETRRPYGPLSLSPDGNRLAVQIENATGQLDIWVYDMKRANWTQLTRTGYAGCPIWTPDGNRVAFDSMRGRESVFWTLADGSGMAEPLLYVDDYGLDMIRLTSFSPDGKAIALNNQKAPGDWNIWTLHFQEHPEARPFVVTSLSEAHGIFSPDGRYIAYCSDQVYVRPYPGPSPQWTMSTDGGASPLWSRDGRELFYRKGGQYFVVPVQTEPEFQAGTPRLLFEVPRVYGARLARMYDVTPDGQRFVMIQEPEKTAEPLQIVYIPNWFEELGQLVPNN